MGLDMYLESMPKIKGLTFEKELELDRKLQNKEISDKERELIEPYIRERGETFTWKTIKTEQAYWRKANAIHRWFVENVQNGVDECEPHQVSKENLEELLYCCKKVSDNNSLAEDFLPTRNGFFFGNTEYNEWYFEKVEYTVDRLEQVIREVDFDENYIIYQSSW